MFFLIDDVRWVEDPDAIDDLGLAMASLVRLGDHVVVNCAAGRTGLDSSSGGHRSKRGRPRRGRRAS